MYKTLRVKLVLIFALMGLVAGGAALTPNLTFTTDVGNIVSFNEASAAPYVDAWQITDYYSYFRGAGNVSCSGGCYGNLNVAIYQDGGLKASANSGWATWANKTVSTPTKLCGYSRSPHNFAVIASFSGGGSDGAYFSAYMSC